MSINVVKIFGLSAFAFFIGIVLTPFLTRYLYKYKMWKKSVRTKTFSGDDAPITSELYKVVMRFWVISVVLAMLGMVIALGGKMPIL